MAHSVKDASLRTYMFKDRAKRIAKQLNAAHHNPGFGSDLFKAVQASEGDGECWIIEVRGNGNLTGWIKL